MHEQSWIGEFTFCIGNFKPFDSYARVEFDYEGKIISGLPDTLYAREGYYNDTMWIVKDVGIVGFTYNKSSSERVYTLVQHTPYSAEGIATKKPVVQ